jgi:hypothetical protein
MPHITKKPAKKPVKKPIIHHGDDTSYGRAGCADAVWKKAPRISGMDPHRFRRCYITKNILIRENQGKSGYGGWAIDHNIPRAKGGGDSLHNLSAVDYVKNIQMADSLNDKPEYLLLYHELLREHRGLPPPPKKSVFRWNHRMIDHLIAIKELPTSMCYRMAVLVAYDDRFVKVRLIGCKNDTLLPKHGDLFYFPQ